METALRHIFMKMIKGAVHVLRAAEPRHRLDTALIFSPLESEPGAGYEMMRRVYLPVRAPLFIPTGRGPERTVALAPRAYSLAQMPLFWRVYIRRSRSFQ